MRMGAMARKPQGTKVRLHDPETGKIVWVERSAIHQTTDEPAEVEASAPAQDGSSPCASAPAQASPSVSSIAPTVAPTIAPPIAPAIDAPIAPSPDGDEHDDVAEFLGEAPPQRARAAPSVPVAPTNSRPSSGDEIADFWAGDEPQVQDA